MKWTERVLEMKASGVVSEADLADSRNYNCCLVGEAAHLLGQTCRNYRGESRANYDTVGRLLDNRTGINDVGERSPERSKTGVLTKRSNSVMPSRMRCYNSSVREGAYHERA